MVWQQLLPSSQQREEEAVCKRTKKPAQWLWNVWKIKFGTCLWACVRVCVFCELLPLWLHCFGGFTPHLPLLTLSRHSHSCSRPAMPHSLTFFCHFFLFLSGSLSCSHARARTQAGTTLTPQLATVTRWLAPPLPRLRNHGAVLALKTVGEEGRWRVSCMRFWLGIW